MQSYFMTIGGSRLESTKYFDVFNPATDELVAQAPQCSREQLDQVVQAADRAFPAWRGRDDAERRQLLFAAADALDAGAERIGSVMTAEQGKPVPDAVADAHRSADWLRYYANLEVEPAVFQDTSEGRVEVVRRPYGVVAGIVPWNSPLLVAIWKTAPALRAGNTVVLKPSSSTPLTALVMAELFAQVFPAGVFNVVTGPEPLGENLATHPLVRKVSFTGSTEVGKHLAVVTASDLKRITLELGGNDAAIVLDDADPATVASDLFWAAFKNNGQMCALIKRLYVPQRRLDEYVEALADVARSARVGNGAEEGTQIGPLTTARQRDSIRDLAEHSLTQGAVAAAGGRAMEGAGNFFEPTILTGVSDGDRIVDEEQFGPILPVIPYRDENEAVARANSSMYGLAGSVWASDVDRAFALARRFESGQVAVNHHTRGIKPHLPFGGFKWSGIGVENGPWGYEAFTQLQALTAPPRAQ